MKSEHAKTVKGMMAALPTIPYPGARGGVTEWRKKAIEAGYPRCEECTMPIARSHWRQSIAVCQTCRYKELGLYGNKGEEGDIWSYYNS